MSELPSKRYVFIEADAYGKETSHYYYATSKHQLLHWLATHHDYFLDFDIIIEDLFDNPKLMPFSPERAQQLMNVLEEAKDAALLPLLTLEEIEALHVHYHTAGQGAQEGLPAKEWDCKYIVEYEEPEFEDVTSHVVGATS